MALSKSSHLGYRPRGGIVGFGPALLFSLALALGVWCLPGAVWAASEQLVVRVLPQPEVFGETFTLGEISEMDGFDLAALQKLASIQITSSPPPGRTMALTEAMVRSRLASWTGPPISLIVPSGMRVERAGQVVTGEEIARMVLDQTGQAAPGAPAKDTRRQVVGQVGDAVIPKGKVEWQTELQGTHLVKGGNRTYRVTAKVDGKQAWHSLVRVQEKTYEKILVAKRPIRRGEKIRRRDLALVRTNVSANRGDAYLTRWEQAIGKKAVRPIGTREPLRSGVVAEPSAVAEGGRVFVEYRSRGLVLSVPGVALVEGRVGQFIPVRNLNSGRVVHGILGADEKVRVD